jgi:hypothetical protein
MYDFCSYGKHPISRDNGGYVILTDKSRGYNDIVCCKSCYREYILKYFPDSTIAGYIRNNPREYPVRDEE